MNTATAQIIARGTRRRRGVPQSYELYRVSMADLEACWKRRAELPKYAKTYLKPGAEIIVGRRAQFEAFAETHDKIGAPWVLFVPYPHGLTVKFLDGRHRTAVLRDAGATHINVQTDAKSVKNAREAGVELTPTERGD